MPKITFSNQGNEFYQQLKHAVDAYFDQKKIKRTGDWRLHLKTIILIGAAIAGYSVLMLMTPSATAALLIAAGMGYVCACIGFGVMHDANHGSYSTRPWLNDALGLSANALGISSFFWKQKHNILHHTYTNVDGIDDDIAKSPMIRQCETQKWVPAHRVQHIYLFPIYCLTSIFWIFIMDFVKYFKKKIYTTAAWKMSAKNQFIFWFTKIGYITFYIVLPIVKWGFLPWLIGFLVMHFTLGLTLSVVFQLAHVVENTTFEHVSLTETKHLESGWAIHELKTTSNFAMENKFISWFAGGLNYQIEHHLFPKVSHVHYPAISKIVQQKCKEFQLPYNQYQTMGAAIASHYRFMKWLGKKPKAVSQQIAA